jgi:hypothetical protein
MGLAERRKQKELEDVTFPERVKEITEICGAAIPYDVAWDTLDTYDALNFIDNVSCHRLNMALRVICMDDLGKQAVRDKLQKVRLVNVADSADKRLAFDGGTLEMRCNYAAGLSGAFSDSEIRALLEAKL